uniref:Uncharacterized protein n=1 Tax=Chromera velia CCMP2878 TaxID=1169474 RepID=A0A0G4HPZ5_9ALVE|eukprot:Cvel_30111.t1-p1 / transcript=Cvel_30111.t1 / gene=Cvel_30111 / organism=Chromera_velia_CCMP2878 / gene_product=Protochlorophyllide reductase C, chloroplastic, putative / transcript_product=Protochlorophyllide reductase C, chloroplastic, putative / location=Cvel_scaffold4248:1461-2804(+) / protein_length=448 / sequence_SO=supercontig / SO=protein_coding / is_pseudo=false
MRLLTMHTSMKLLLLVPLTLWETTQGFVRLPPSPRLLLSTSHAGGRQLLRTSRTMRMAAEPSDRSRSRRNIIFESSKAVPLSVVGVETAMRLSTPPTAMAEGDVKVERVVSETDLVAHLASAPRRSVVVTGSNSGVGFEGAKLLAAAGHRVVCACRNSEKAQKAADLCNEYAAASTTTGVRAGGEAIGMVCDLADLTSVRKFAAELKNARTPLDTLCLNAGLAMNTADTAPQRTRDGFELTIGTNHLGHFLLANLLKDALAKAEKPRVVVTASPVHDPNSGGGNVGSKATLGDLSGLKAGPDFSMIDGGVYDADKAYKDSKLCNMLFTAEASRRFQKLPSGGNAISVNAFSPGLIPNPQGFFRYQNQAFANIFNVISGTVGVTETPRFGGECLAYMAVDEALDGVINGWYDTYPAGKHQLAVHAPSIEAQDLEKQKLLWELSEKVVGI